MHTLSPTRRSIKTMRARSVPDTILEAERRKDRRINKQSIRTYLYCLLNVATQENVPDGIEGVCFDELMADSDDLLMCTPGESGQVVIIKTPSFYCQGPCVSHPRKQRVEGRSVSRQRPENEDREDAEQALWLRDRHRTFLDAWLPFCLMFRWSGKMIWRAGLENREQTKGTIGPISSERPE